MDTTSAVRANQILDNAPDVPVFECYLPGQVFEFNKACDVSFSGADGTITRNGQQIRSDYALSLLPHDKIRIETMDNGSRIYMALKASLKVQKLLGSCSELSGYLSSHLKRNDMIDFDLAIPGSSTHSRIARLNIDTGAPIKAYPGPEAHILTKAELMKLISSNYIISESSNRMGYRLNGIAMNHKGPSQIISSAVLPGTVQLLPNGLPIVLMRNCQTTGGYPRILQITEESINQLAQRRPGQHVNFSLFE